jgi:hypothetical protein
VDTMNRVLAKRDLAGFMALFDDTRRRVSRRA